jgi:hypothetical protein
VLVACCPSDSSQALLGHTHEMVLSSRCTNRIDRHCQASIGTVLEANGERETRGELTVQLRLGCSRTNGTERDEVGKELRGDCVEHLGRNGHARGGEVDEQLSRDSQTLVDLVALVNVWVVDQPLPADRCSWFLEVGAHDDAEVVLKLVGKGLEALAVLECQLRVVERTGPDHDKETVIFLGDDAGGFLATLNDGLLGMCGDGDLSREKLGWDQRVVTKDCAVILVPV